MQMAEQMHTSRAQIDRILKAKGNVTIVTLQRAAALVGRKPYLEFEIKPKFPWSLAKMRSLSLAKKRK